VPVEHVLGAEHVPVGQELPPDESSDVLNEEISFAGFFAPHFGQVFASSARVRAKWSNLYPHFLH